MRNAVKEAGDDRDERDSSAGANLSCAEMLGLSFYTQIKYETFEFG